MKQFNLQEYLAHPERKVITRDGRDVRIICTDSDAEGGPIVAIVTMANQRKQVLLYYENGKYYSLNSVSEDDLFFVVTKRTEYINIYRNEFGYFLGGGEYSTEEEAKKVAVRAGDTYITTIKLEREE